MEGDVINSLPFHQKVLGIGLGRTGTASLSEALNILGIHTRHFLNYKSLLMNFRADDKVFYGNQLLEMLNHYQGIANGTGLPYKELDAMYPGSRFILTVRDKNEWLKSKKTYSLMEMENWSMLDQETKWSKRFVRENVYGSFQFDAQRWLETYEEHVRNVRDYFKNRQDDLLVMDITKGDGWAKLCPFLGLPVPQVPFPAANSRQSVSKWNKKVVVVQNNINKLISANCGIILVDGCQLGLEHPRILPFLEHEGIYWGNPQNDDTAISELERMRREGAGFIVFVWLTFWWFNNYSGFHRYLNSEFSCIVENEYLAVFDIRKKQLDTSRA